MTADTMRLPQVTRRMTRDEVLLARGTADAYALRRVPRRDDLRPLHAAGRDGARPLRGDGEPPAARRWARAPCRAPPATSTPRSPTRPGAWATPRSRDPRRRAAGHRRPAISSATSPPAARCRRARENVMDLWRGFLESRPAARSRTSSRGLDDQQAFARFARRVIEDLGYGDQLGDDPDAADDEDDEAEGGDEEESPDQQERPRTPRTTSTEASPNSQPGPDAGAAGDAGGDGRRRRHRDGRGGGASTRAKPRRAPPAAAAFRRRPGLQGLLHRFDEEIAAEDLADPVELERLRAYLDQQLEPLKGAVAASPTGCSAGCRRSRTAPGSSTSRRARSTPAASRAWWRTR